jgi:beta-glucosidase
LARFHSSGIQTFVCCLALAGLSCSGSRDIASPYRDAKLSPERRVNDLIRHMRPDEKLALLRGARTMSIQANERLGIPSLRVVTGVMGISAKDSAGQPIYATAFPANIAVAATWNPQLAEQEGAAIARQAHTLGMGQILGPIAAISRSPLSGKVFESYGEDPWLASRMVAGYVTGAQGEGIIATALFDGAPAKQRAARELDLLPLETAVAEAGVFSVMPGSGDGARELVGTLLEDRLAFSGFPVFSRTASDDPAVTPSNFIDERVRGVLRAMFASGAFDMKASETNDVETSESRALARRIAGQGIVLLKNEAAVLPLDRSKIRSVAVFGPNASVNRMAAGSYTVVSKTSVTPIAALRSAFGDSVLAGSDVPLEAAKAASRADVAIVFAGTGAQTEGETMDRASLDLPSGQDELIEAVAKANSRTIVVLTNGSPVAMNKWLGGVAAVVEAWFPGEECGNAIVDVLTGAVNPSGRLPVTFPSRLEDLAGGDAGLFSGYRRFDRDKIEPLFPFGFGLSYTKFEYSNLVVTPERARPGQLVLVSLTLRNAGSREGKETVQLYSHAIGQDRESPAQELRAFEQVSLKPGEAKRVYFTLTDRVSSYFDEAKVDWVAVQGSFEVRVGSSSRDIRATGTFSVSE